MGGGLSESFKERDPADLSGLQTKRRQEAAERQIAENRRRMQELMDSMPEYNVEANKYSGQLNKKLRSISNVNAGERFGRAGQATDILQQRAFGTEESPWLKMQLEQQQLGQQQAREDLSGTSALRQQEQLDQLAMQGGLSSGARERIGRQSLQGRMMQEQQLARQGQMDRMGLRSAEEQRRMQLQQQMPGMQLGLDQYQTGLHQQNRASDFQKASMWQQQANVDEQRRLANAQAKQQLELQAWQQKMAAEGGLAESSALLRSGLDTGAARYKTGGMGVGGFGTGGLI
jgi:hypothetical protein